MKGIKDTRAFDRMIAQRKSYASISQALAREGIALTPTKVYRYITHKENPHKSIRKALAKALGCAEEEIF